MTRGLPFFFFFFGGGGGGGGAGYVYKGTLDTRKKKVKGTPKP